MSLFENSLMNHLAQNDIQNLIGNADTAFIYYKHIYTMNECNK